MRSRPLAAGLLCLLFASAAAHARVTLHIAGSDPDSPATLGHWEQYYVLVRYESDQPIRVRGEAYYRGKRVTAMTSGSPRHAPGTGEAMFWFAYTDPARVDRIVMRAEDDTGAKTLAQTERAVELAWTGVRGSPRNLPGWVQRMRAEQDRRALEERREQTNRPVPWWESALFIAAMWSIPLYFVVQVIALRRLRGGWRLAAAVPAIPMLFILGHAMVALVAGSNLFPLGLVFTCAPALAYLLIVLGLSRLALARAAAE